MQGVFSDNNQAPFVCAVFLMGFLNMEAQADRPVPALPVSSNGCCFPDLKHLYVLVEMTKYTR